MSNLTKGMMKTFNGDTVIGFMNSKAVKELGWADRASLNSWYQDDPSNNYMGMIDLFSNYAEEEIPFMKGLFNKRAVIEVNGMDGSFTYDLPVYKKTGTYTAKDTSNDHGDTPGIDESYFTIALNNPFQPGDILGYDASYGQQFVISEDHTVVQEGDYWLHTVQMVSNSGAAYFPKEKLKAGIRYWKIGHSLGEFSEQYSNLENGGAMGSITCEFTLGNHRGVESFYTMYADKKKVSGAMTKSQDVWNKFRQHQEKNVDEMGRSLDMMFIGKKNPASGKVLKSSISIGATLEYMVILENAKLEALSNIYQRGGIVKSTNGNKRLNEGAWHQVRRGKKITYSRPGGITKDHIRQVAAYVFQNTKIKPTERVLKFKAGWGAYQNIMQIFRTEFTSQIAALGNFMGTDRQIPNPITGGLDGLTLRPVILKSAYIPDIGMIECEHDPSLDHQMMADRRDNGFIGQGNHKDSYSLIIWDAGSAEYSNARTAAPAGTKFIDGADKSANVYYVKPEGDHVFWGKSVGRWDKDQASNIVSSLKTMSSEFWIHSASAAWVKDITRSIIVELKR